MAKKRHDIQLRRRERKREIINRHERNMEKKKKK